MRVLLVDDHNLVRNGIASLLAAHSIDVVGEAINGLEALEKARHLNPDVILMDINMPRLNGLESTRLIKAEMPNIKIIILTVSEEEEKLFEAIKSGADGYLLKDIKAEDFLNLLKGVANGESAISPTMAYRIIEEFTQISTSKKEKSSRDELSDKERKVLELIRNGDLNKEIALKMHISENTVKYHVRNIMDKLHLRNRASIAAYAANHQTNLTSSDSQL